MEHAPRTRRIALVAAVALAAGGAVLGGYSGVSLLTSPAVETEARLSEPVATPVPTEGPRRVVLHGTGDVNLDPRQLGALRSGVGVPWEHMRGLFTTDDLTVVNLECAASDLGEPAAKEFTFRCDTDALPAMREAGVEVANLGNNHSRDYGPAALSDAYRRLEAADIAPVGGGADATAATAPALFEIGGHTIAVVGFGGVVPHPSWIAGHDHPGVANGYAIPEMVKAVQAADAVADYVFVSIHWGAELDTEPRADDIARAEAMIDAGADGIWGHHAHRVQPLGWYRERPIAWGLGNFVWPGYGAGARSAVAEFVIEPDGSISACLLPATIRGGIPSLDGPASCAA